MADTVQVDLVAGGNLSAEAKKASAAMEALAKKEKNIAGVAKELGKSHKEVSKALDVAAAKSKALANEEKKRLALEAKGIAKLKADQKKKASEAERQSKDLEIRTKKLLKGDVVDAFGLGAAGVAGVAVVATLAVAAVAATALTVAIGTAAMEALKLRNSAQGTMDVLTNGRGAEALALVDGLAEQVGMKFGDARDKFIQFRQAGADNKTSANLLKLVADLNTVDSSGKLAAEAIEKTLAHKDAKGNVIVKDAAAQMALLAKQAHVAGDGTAALAAKYTTLGGALNSLDNSKTSFLEEVGKRVAPAIDKAAGAVAEFVDNILKTQRGERIINGIASAIELVANVVEGSLPYVEAAIDGVFAAFDTLSPAIEIIKEQFAVAFGGDKASAIDTVKGAVQFLATAVGGALTVIAGLVGIVIKLQMTIYDAYGAVMQFVGGLFGLGGSAFEIGSQIVSGLINGITSMVGSLFAKVTGIADGIKAKFRDALSIHSPSKVFEGYGKNTAQGFEIGLEKNAPDSGGVAETMIPSGPPQTAGGGSARAGAAAGGGSSGGAGGVQVFITIQGASSGSPDELMRAARREFEMAMASLKLARGQ